MGLRQNRLADEVRTIIGSCFQGGTLSDPRLDGVTITSVKVSADLQIATVYFRLYGNEEKEAALKGLESASGFLKRRIAEGIELRRVPHLKFFYDESIENASKIEDLLRRL